MLSAYGLEVSIDQNHLKKYHFLMRIKIESHEITGAVVEHTYNQSHDFFIIDLDTQVKIAPDTEYPPIAIWEKETWCPAKIDRVPSGPNFNRIILSTEKQTP